MITSLDIPQPLLDDASGAGGGEDILIDIIKQLIINCILFNV